MSCHFIWMDITWDVISYGWMSHELLFHMDGYYMSCYFIWMDITWVVISYGWILHEMLFHMDGYHMSCYFIWMDITWVVISYGWILRQNITPYNHSEIAIDSRTSQEACILDKCSTFSLLYLSRTDWNQCRESNSWYWSSSFRIYATPRNRIRNKYTITIIAKRCRLIVVGLIITLNIISVIQWQSVGHK